MKLTHSKAVLMVKLTPLKGSSYGKTDATPKAVLCIWRHKSNSIQCTSMTSDFNVTVIHNGGWWSKHAFFDWSENRSLLRIAPSEKGPLLKKTKLVYGKLERTCITLTLVYCEELLYKCDTDGSKMAYFQNENLEYLESTNFLRCETIKNEFYAKFSFKKSLLQVNSTVD